MWILSHAFFAETFQPMNAAVTFQIGLKDSARAIRGKFTFAGARESCWVIRTMCTNQGRNYCFPGLVQSEAISKVIVTVQLAGGLRQTYF